MPRDFPSVSGSPAWKLGTLFIRLGFGFGLGAIGGCLVGVESFTVAFFIGEIRNTDII